MNYSATIKFEELWYVDGFATEAGAEWWADYVLRDFQKFVQEHDLKRAERRNGGIYPVDEA